jgi:hypothetical protein
MKQAERLKARKLRLEGLSIGEIANRVGVAKSSVSLWVRDIELSPAQRKQLSRNGYSIELIEKRRIRRLENIRLKRAAIMQEAARDIKKLSPDLLWLMGVALYWGEGGKTVRGGVRLSNSDPAVISLMMRFFRETCKVPDEKFRGHIHTFSHSNADAAERFWSRVSSIPRKRFYKTYVKPSGASKNKRDTLPYGTLEINVHDTTLFFKITGWIEKVKVLLAPN